MTVKRIVFLVIGLVFAVFVLQNAQVVEVRLFFWTAQASRALVLIGTFILGLFAGWLSGLLLKKERESDEK
jgi:uncharacterized integral membrane protein